MAATEVINGYLSDNVAVDQAIAATVAGTSTITQSTALDCAGYDRVLIVAVLGTAATNNSITLQTGATTTTADTSATVAATATNGVLLLDVGLDKRYIKVKVTRGTSTTIDQVLAIRYNGRSKAVAQTVTSGNDVLAQFQL